MTSRTSPGGKVLQDIKDRGSSYSGKGPGQPRTGLEQLNPIIRRQELRKTNFSGQSPVRTQNHLVTTGTHQVRQLCSPSGTGTRETRPPPLSGLLRGPPARPHGCETLGQPGRKKGYGQSFRISHTPSLQNPNPKRQNAKKCCELHDTQEEGNTGRHRTSASDPVLLK